MKRELDQVLAELLARCSCDACERYRRSFAMRAGKYAAAIEESLRGGAR